MGHLVSVTVAKEGVHFLFFYLRCKRCSWLPLFRFCYYTIFKMSFEKNINLKPAPDFVIFSFSLISEIFLSLFFGDHTKCFSLFFDEMSAASITASPHLVPSSTKHPPRQALLSAAPEPSHPRRCRPPQPVQSACAMPST